MSFIFQCPYCGQQMQGEESWSGQQTQCPNCQQLIQIPDVSLSQSSGYTPTSSPMDQPWQMGMTDNPYANYNGMPAASQPMGNGNSVPMMSGAPFMAPIRGPVAYDKNCFRKTLNRFLLHLILFFVSCAVCVPVVMDVFDIDEPFDVILSSMAICWVLAEGALLTVFFMLWIYRSWNLLPPDKRRCRLWMDMVSPGLAVGLLFIPFFNFYWIMVAFFGLPFVYKNYLGQDNGACPIAVIGMIMTGVSQLFGIVTLVLEMSVFDWDCLELVILSLAILIGSLVLQIILMCKMRQQCLKLVPETPSV